MAESDAEIRASFLADVLANPDDDGPRLVFADWLIQRGDPRGELIVTQCKLEHATGSERMRLVNRASNLLYRQGSWLNEIRAVVRGVETKRGFVASINATASVFAKQCGPWFEREPITELRLIKPSTRDLATLRKAPHAARLRSLVVLDAVTISTTADAEALATLLAALPELRVLDLPLDAAEPAATRDLLGKLALPVLAQLKLRIRSADMASIANALTGARLPAVRQLGVPQHVVRVVAAAFPDATVTAIGEP